MTVVLRDLHRDAWLALGIAEPKDRVPLNRKLQRSSDVTALVHQLEALRLCCYVISHLCALLTCHQWLQRGLKDQYRLDVRDGFDSVSSLHVARNLLGVGQCGLSIFALLFLQNPF